MSQRITIPGPHTSETSSPRYVITQQFGSLLKIRNARTSSKVYIRMTHDLVLVHRNPLVDVLRSPTSIDKKHVFGHMAACVYVTVFGSEERRAFRQIMEGEAYEYAAHKTAVSNDL